MDPWHFSTDPNPAFFVSGWQDANKKEVLFFTVSLLITFWKYIYISFHRKKSQKRSHKIVDSYFFCLFMEGSGSGFGRPKNIRILRIRIHYTGFKLLSWLTAIRTVSEEKCFIWLTDFDFLGDVNTVLFKADIIQLKSEVKKELASLKKLQKVSYRYFICYIQCCGSGIQCLFGP